MIRKSPAYLFTNNGLSYEFRALGAALRGLCFFVVLGLETSCNAMRHPRILASLGRTLQRLGSPEEKCSPYLAIINSEGAATSYIPDPRIYHAGRDS